MKRKNIDSTSRFSRYVFTAVAIAIFPLIAAAQLGTEQSPYALVGVTGTAEKQESCPAGMIGDPQTKCWPISSGNPADGSQPYTPGPTISNPTVQGGPCTTTDPTVNDPVFGLGMEALWSGSNAEDILIRRKERGGWIVKTPNGVRVHDWGVEGNAAGFCTNPLTSALSMPPEGRSAIIGFIHTHPYHLGENVLTCEGQVATYDGTPSTEDLEMSFRFGEWLDGRKTGLPGIMIDKQRIVKFRLGQDPITGGGVLNDVAVFSRCAY